jgi:triacylglycerol esterase/lipase EstA (alpha/beta hydrolase family)
MGGLDCRALVHLHNLEFEVLSITTVGTPHHGSPYADTFDNNSFGQLMLPDASALNAVTYHRQA